jgi:hypothetical protein
MKYLSVVIFIALMSWTWCLATTPSDTSLETLTAVEAEFAEALREQIQLRRPDAREIFFQKLYTEGVQPNGEIRAHFRYQINATKEGESTEEIIEGTATRRFDEETKTWAWHIDEVSAPSVRFREGTKVSPLKGAESPEQNAEEQAK